MKSAFNDVGELVPAHKALKSLSTYLCPCCGDLVFKAEGIKQSAHFRHKKGGKKEYCELYTQGLGSSYDPNDYATMLKSPFLTIEESDNKWDLFIRFPKIRKGLTRLFEDRKMYFNVICKESHSQLPSVYLKHNSEKNKLKVEPKQNYNFNIDKKDLATELGIMLPENINGIHKRPYIFAYLHGLYIKTEKKLVSSSNKFYVLSKRRINLHDSLEKVELVKKGEWYGYRVKLPSMINNSLINWFYNYFGIELVYPNSNIDMLFPSIYSRQDQAYNILENRCTILITYSDISYENPSLVHIDTDMKSSRHALTNDKIEFDQLSVGYHTFYIGGLEGKILTIFISDDNNKLDLNSKIVINNTQKFLFKDKNIEVRDGGLLKIYTLYNMWKQRRNSFPEIITANEDRLSKDVTTVFAPGIWNFKVKRTIEMDSNQIDWKRLVKAYERFEYIKTVIITKDRFLILKKQINNLEDVKLKRILSYYINYYQTQVPLGYLGLHDNESDEGI